RGLKEDHRVRQGPAVERDGPADRSERRMLRSAEEHPVAEKNNEETAADVQPPLPGEIRQHAPIQEALFFPGTIATAERSPRALFSAVLARRSLFAAGHQLAGDGGRLGQIASLGPRVVQVLLSFAAPLALVVLVLLVVEVVIILCTGLVLAPPRLLVEILF